MALVNQHSTLKSLTKHNDDVFSKAFTLADSALKYKPPSTAFEYTGGFENPFRLLSETFAAPVKRSPTVAMLGPIKLTLKGVLLKEKPLAILEDESNKTFICSIGDKIGEDFIESIEANRVTLRGKRGPYTLIVKE
jgi:hypothetical protein